ncbi:hypothetical protein U5A82_06085 [Sphingobium sp. CR2-8]|uniref:hypothetical protein n=1 Tax=Sphingobium sp. CR2-8 TaxID=1306534 RepID=UPI002DBE7E42|nr:hypothetical protein [Sphingobium sp. CR2-8]MEC3910058.1 hypothetical protein [Sphingobium sp. CR2-8]
MTDTPLDARMADAILTLDQMDNDVMFYHHADERAYFEWLERIPCVASVKGEGSRGLVVKLKRRPGNDDLRQFLALAYRYKLDMKKFAKFETETNREWFRDRRMFWYKHVFSD